MDDSEILKKLRRNTKDRKLSDFVCEIFKKEFNGQPWVSSCESMLDDYIGSDEE